LRRFGGPAGRRCGIQSRGITAGLNPIANAQRSVPEAGGRRAIGPLELAARHYIVKGSDETPNLDPIPDADHAVVVAIGPWREIGLEKG
jgi:hypothetical protein